MRNMRMMRTREVKGNASYVAEVEEDEDDDGSQEEAEGCKAT